ncbi:MAG TPA: acyl-CoA dehydrogenase family protein [Conexibacter sp.]|nr:acyl-CoA dehydrogenase family protein [Conexibacter sp.]
MHFDFTDDQREIKRTARELLAARSSLERVRAVAEGDGIYDAALWEELVGLGWTGIALPEEHGGVGLGVLELAIVLEELGYAATPSRFLSNALAAQLILGAGSDEQRARLLHGIAAGAQTGTVAFARDGVAELVPDADSARWIVLVEEGAARLYDAATGEVRIDPRETIDPTRRYARVTVADHTAGEPLEGDVAGGLDRAETVLAAELTGLAQRALELTVAYVKERRQFGTPIGAFQAVSHRAAQMLLESEGARSAVWFAAWAADAEPASLPRAASIAKAAAADAGRTVTAAAIQLHGGIGFTWEADVHWLYKRAQLDAALLGGARRHRAALAGLAAARVAGT